MASQSQITLASLLTTTALTGGSRITLSGLLTAMAVPSDKRVTSFHLVTAYPLGDNKRVTSLYLQTARSIHTAFQLVRLESNSELYPLTGDADDNGTGNPGEGGIGYTLAAGPIPEHNPYRPRIPEQFIGIGEDFYDFYEENQQIHREQHNITQMGDTTFPFQLAIQTHDIKQFKLGSVGRFYHELFGVIQARYVQFLSMEPVSFAQCPLGLFRNRTLLEWKVTNNLDLSHPDLVVGISFPYAVPANESFGWVIVDGPTLQEVKNDSADAVIGESFAWNATGSVSNAAEGKVIGRRVNKVHEATSLLPGQLWVRTESFSEQQLRNLIDNQTASLLAAVQALQDALGAIPGATELSALNALITSIQTRLNQEITARRAADLAIQQQLAGLDFVTITQLNNAVTNAANALTAAVSSLQVQIDEIRAIALQALAQSNQPPDLTSIENQITLILGMISTEIARVKGRFPVVDGSVPPNLVYLDDGSLVYVETF